VTRWLALAIAAIAGCSGRARPPRARDAGPPRSTTTWSISLTDGEGGSPFAGRVLLFDAADQPVRIGALDLDDRRQATSTCALAPDVIGTWDGLLLATGVADVPIGVDPCEPSPAIPYGLYRVWAWRGPEHEQWEGDVDLREGRGRVRSVIALERVGRPAGVAADLHVHAAASNDSGVPNQVRAVAQAAVGVQVLALSDHNVAGDLGQAIHAVGLDGVLVSLASIELSGEIHVGVYPWQPRPLDVATLEAATIDELFAFAAGVPGQPVIQLDHPRLRWAALFDDTGWDGMAWPPPFALGFDAVEVLSGDTTFNAAEDRRLDQAIADFYTLIDHGYLVTAVGNSDTHHLNGIRDAVTRNYVALDSRAWPIDEAAFVDAIRHREAWTTSGPLLEVEVRGDGGGDGVGPGGVVRARTSATVSIALRQARWVVTDTVRVRVGGRRGPELVRELAVPRGVREASWTVPVPLRGKDTWIGVDAIGDTPLPVEISGTYLAEDGRPGAAPAALINPVLVDGDGDGWWQRGDGRVLIEGARAIGGRASLRHVVRPAPRRSPPDAGPEPRP